MNITVVLLNGDRIYHAPAQREQEISFGSGKKDNVKVEGFDQSQVCVKIGFDSFSVSARKSYGVEQKNVPFDTFVILDRISKTYLFVNAVTSEKTSTIKLPYDCMLRIGRDDTNDVVLKFPFVTGEHLILKSEAGKIRVEDQGTRNGTYLNGKRIGVSRMESGDVISLMSVQIKLINGILYFENAGNKLRINGVSGGAAADYATHASLQRSTLKYRRSPRAKEKLPSEDIVLASAPTKSQKFEKGRGMFSSLAGTSAMMAGSMITGIASPALLAARAASLVAPVTSVVSNKGANKKRKKNAEQYDAMRRERYGAYIEAQKARIGLVADEQREIIMRENPTVSECIEITTGLKRNLWERTPDDNDFLSVRVGMGYEPLCVAVKARQDSATFNMESDEVDELSAQIIEETKIVDNVPARVSLLNNAFIGVVGNRNAERELVRNMTVSLCTSHCYEDVRIAGIFDDSERAFWSPMRWLPHIWDDNKQFRALSFDKRGAHAICEWLGEIITERQKVRDGSYNVRQIPLPHYVVIFGSKEMVEREDVMRILFESGDTSGVTAVFIFDDMYLLPHQCKYIINLSGDPCAYDSTETNNKFFFTPDRPIGDSAFDVFARRMSAIELDGFSKRAGLPDSITFLKGFNAETIDELNVLSRWRDSQPYNTLAAPIGVMNGEKTFCLDIHEKAHGPHGLVAGTTGSGKSELLQTWILSVALNYHPHDVTFVLIDYKGGGMASLLEPLPHVVGKITNIGSNIDRSLVSLQSEIKRRQRLFDEAGVNHIDKYQRLYKRGMAEEPLPHLIIVADEFAELKKEEPDFMSGLISASRVGRSLGIHLVLATQKPGGIVDDQIQSNSRFRLCLKVQDVNDSREMIKRPDAARLTQPGRAYIRVGEDEYFDLFQSYFSGAPYIENETADGSEREDFSVSIVEINGCRNQLIPKNTRVKSTDIDELQAVVDHLVRIAGEQGIRPLPGPWLPELPENLSLEDLEAESKNLIWPMLPVGMFDDPKAQAQGLQTIDLSADGHYAFYGASGTGKTTLLKTVIMGIGRYYGPDEICVYIIDAGGWSLSAFSEMPNVGGVALDSEEEKIEKLQNLILDEFEKRKKLFLKNAVSSLKAYREDVCSDLPAIVIAVDNIVPLFEMYQDIENFFVTIARDGATYGIYLIYTANSTSGVRYKIIQNVRGAAAFELTDKGDYPTIVGRPGEALPKIAGRAYFKGNPPVIFQAAVPFSCSGDREMNELIRRECAELSSHWRGSRPKAIPVMPEVLTNDMLMHSFTDRWMIPTGYAYDVIEPYAFDLSERYSLLVTGSIQSGKSAALIRMMRTLAGNGSNTRLIVFDSKSKSLSAFQNTAVHYAASDDNAEITGILGYLVEQLNLRQRQLNAAKNEHSGLDQKQFSLTFEQIAIVIDDLKEFVDEVSDENLRTTERICRFAKDLGVIVLCAGRMADISRYNEVESLTRTIVANQQGLVLSGTPAQYPYFRNSLKYSEKEIEAGEGNAYIYDDGACRRIKLPQ